MGCRTGRLCLWPFALHMAFPCSLSGRNSTDYYDQSVPPLLLRPKHVSLSRAGTRWFLGSCLVTGWGDGMTSERVLPDRELENWVLRVDRHSNLPNLCSGFIAIVRSTIYSSPGIADHVCQPRLGHVSSSPMTGYPFPIILNVCLLGHGLPRTTRSFPLEADRHGMAWHSMSPG